MSSVTVLIFLPFWRAEVIHSWCLSVMQTVSEVCLLREKLDPLAKDVSPCVEHTHGNTHAGTHTHTHTHTHTYKHAYYRFICNTFFCLMHWIALFLSIAAAMLHVFSRSVFADRWRRQLLSQLSVWIPSLGTHLPCSTPRLPVPSGWWWECRLNRYRVRRKIWFFGCNNEYQSFAEWSHRIWSHLFKSATRVWYPG